MVEVFLYSMIAVLVAGIVSLWPLLLGRNRIESFTKIITNTIIKLSRLEKPANKKLNNDENSS